MEDYCISFLEFARPNQGTETRDATADVMSAFFAAWTSRKQLPATKSQLNFYRCSGYWRSSLQLLFFRGLADQYQASSELDVS